MYKHLRILRGRRHYQVEFSLLHVLYNGVSHHTRPLHFWDLVSPLLSPPLTYHRPTRVVLSGGVPSTQTRPQIPTRRQSVPSVPHLHGSVHPVRYVITPLLRLSFSYPLTGRTNPFTFLGHTFLVHSLSTSTPTSLSIHGPVSPGTLIIVPATWNEVSRTLGSFPQLVPLRVISFRSFRRP